MENSFFYWGPLLFKTKIDNYKKILNKVKKKYSYNKNLASHLDETFIFNPNEFKKNIDKAFNDYLNFYETYYNTTLSNKKYDVTASWVNFMKAGDFNPPHTHGDDFSCVLYLKIPDLLKKENDSYEGRDKSGPGAIQFIYGEERIHCVTGVGLKPEEGDMLIFPANLRHVVNPFKSKCIRISMSANFKLQQTRRRK